MFTLLKAEKERFFPFISNVSQGAKFQQFPTILNFLKRYENPHTMWKLAPFSFEILPLGVSHTSGNSLNSTNGRISDQRNLC